MKVVDGGMVKGGRVPLGGNGGVRGLVEGVKMGICDGDKEGEGDEMEEE